MVTDGSGMYFVIWIRSLTYILHAPLLQILFPANASRFYEITFLIALFDFLESLDLWDEQGGLFDGNVNMDLNPQQIENIGYESHNSIINLNTVAIVFVLLSLQIMLGVILRFMHKFVCT